MVIVCWGNQAKSATDVTRIEQAMEDYVSGHQQDPNAHMDSGEALGDHRSQSELDHAIYSILNKYTYPQIRTYKAIVDPAGFGDLTSIQTAIDYVSGLGGGSILIKAGTYTLSDDITLASNVSLEGEGPDITILDFNSTAKVVKIVGVSTTEETDTWSLPHDSKIITGVGTNFTSITAPGEYFNVNGVPYKIATVDSTTQLTLQETYQGVAIVAEVGFTIWVAKANIGVKNLTITGSGGVTADTGSGLRVSIAVDCKIENVISRENDYYGFSLKSSYNLKLQDLVAKGNASRGFHFVGNRAMGVADCQAISNESYGFYIQEGQTGSIGFTRCEAYQNDLDGFHFASCNYITLEQCYSDYNSRDGIRAASGDFNTIIGCRANKNEGYGINIASEYCNEFIVVANTARLNTTGNFNDLAPDTHVGHNSFV